MPTDTPSTPPENGPGGEPPPAAEPAHPTGHAAAAQPAAQAESARTVERPDPAGAEAQSQPGSQPTAPTAATPDHRLPDPAAQLGGQAGGSGSRTALATAPGSRPHPGPGGRQTRPGGGPPQALPGAREAATHAPLNGPWADTSVFGSRWPGPIRPASRATVIALLVAAVVAALSIPLDRGGIGWLVTAIAGVGALIVARVVPDQALSATPPATTTQPMATPAATANPSTTTAPTMTAALTAPAPLVRWSPPAPAKSRFFWTGATIVLLGVGTFRAAGWLFFLCLCTAVVTGALAVAGGRSLRAMIIAVLMTPAAGFRSLPWIKRGVTAARRNRGGKGLRISATIAVSVALLFVFGSLFASADPAFADLVGKAVPDIDAGTVARWIFVFLVAAFALGSAAYLRAAPPDLSGLERPGKRRVARLEWAVPLMLLVLLFALFVAVQLAVLFGGSKHVLDTDGLTYAEYARGGFWQLLIVTGLTLVVLAGAARWAPRETKTDRVLIRGILGSLAVLTLVVVASATHRMDVYADTYGLTRLRLLVVICELWLGLVFLLILIAGIRLTGLWLPRAVVAAAVLALIGLSVANPDRLIADHNVTRFEQTGRIDTAYLSDLSADAVPALDRLTGKNRDCALAPLATELEENGDDWRGWNLGRYQARDLLVHDPAHDNAECPGYYGYR